MPFKPKYTITDKILNNLTLIALAREIIEQAYLVPKWEAKLRRQALLHNTHSSTAIEGNKLTLKQVEALVEGKDVVATNKDKQEVLNYKEALEKISTYAEEDKITKKMLLDIHRIVTRDTLESSSDCGKFRNRQVYIGRRVFDGTGFREEVTYMPPETRKVPKLVDEFLNWLNLEKTCKCNPVLLAGIVHYEIARIHPFIDGNGRTARLPATLLLYKNGFDHRRFFALDDYYDEDRSSYYAALKTAQQQKGDITKWLEYFTDGVLYSINKVKAVIEKLSFAQDMDETERIELTSRQIKILESLKEKAKITNKDLRIMFKISRQAILKEISKLIDAKLIELVGKGRGAYYRLIKKARG